MPQESPPTVVIVQNPVALQNPIGAVVANVGATNGLALDGAPIAGQSLDPGGSSVAGWLSQIRKSILDLQAQQKESMQSLLIELRLLNAILANPAAFNVQEDLDQLRVDIQQDIPPQ
jgi:hypothetical protein